MWGASQPGGTSTFVTRHSLAEAQAASLAEAECDDAPAAVLRVLLAEDNQVNQKIASKMLDYPLPADCERLARMP